MAERLKQFPTAHAGVNGGRRYPWDLYLDGSVWRLAQGRDYTCRGKSIVSQANKMGRMRGLRVRTVVEGDTVVIQASDGHGAYAEQFDEVGMVVA